MKRYFKKGDYLQTSKGEYSDYCVGPVYIVLEDFDLKFEVKQVKKDLNPKRVNPHEGRDVYDYDQVYEKLIERLPLEEVAFTEVWLGSYGEFTEEVFEDE